MLLTSRIGRRTRESEPGGHDRCSDLPARPGGCTRAIWADTDHLALCEPGDDVFKVAGETCPRPRPGDRLGHHPLATRAAKAAQLALQVAARRAEGRDAATAAARAGRRPRDPDNRNA